MQLFNLTLNLHDVLESTKFTKKDLGGKSHEWDYKTVIFGKVSMSIFSQQLQWCCSALPVLNVTGLLIHQRCRTWNAPRWSHTSGNTARLPKKLNCRRLLRLDDVFKRGFWRCRCLVASILWCTLHYYSQCSSSHFYFICPCQYLPPLHSDGEVSTGGCWAYILNRIPFQIKFKWPPQLISRGSPDNLIHNSVLSQGLEGHNEGLNGGEMLLNGLFVCA